MRSYPIFLLALVAFLFVACEKDTLKTTDNNDFQQYMNEADQKLAEADALLAQDLYVSERSAVILPAESVNGLAKAIREAGPFGTVIVEGGMHYESATVKITHPVIILGEENEVAVIQSTTSPNADFPYTLDPAIYLDHARQVQIEGLHFVPDLATGQGGTAILVSNSDRAYIRDNDFSGYLQAVMVYASDFVRIHYNRAEGLFTEGFEGFNSWGFSVMSGKSAYLRGNVAEDFSAGYFVSDENGILYKNTSTGGMQGFFHCTYGEGLLQLPDETPIHADLSARNWQVISNTAQNTLVGYLVIDGANNCKLINNKAIDCSSYDFEFVGPTTRFGPLLPTSFENYFLTGGRNVTVKNCGVDNTIRGGKLVDTIEDPCS